MRRAFFALFAVFLASCSAGGSLDGGTTSCTQDADCRVDGGLNCDNTCLPPENIAYCVSNHCCCSCNCNPI
jgi:hypothetical protein